MTPGVSWALISWKAAKEVGILPPGIHTLRNPPKVMQNLKVNNATDNGTIIVEQLTQEFPSVFSG